MSKQFDPYYEWLGIPPKDQPPNHYRLLGIEVFESNLNVIERAADRQMGHVRTFQSGAHSRASQELLNKLSGAKVCLLNPQRKAEYDAQLRTRLTAPVPSLLEDVPLDPSSVLPVPHQPSASSSPVAILPEVAIVRGMHKPRRKSQNTGMLMVLVGLLLALVAIAVGAFLLVPEKPPVVETPRKLPQPITPPDSGKESKDTGKAGRPQGNPGEVDAVPPIELPANDDVFSPPVGAMPGPNQAVVSPVAQSIDEVENEPRDPVPQESWPPPDEVTRQRIIAAKGIFNDRFALCQTLPFAEFIEAVGELRESGYRPIRARPYGVKEGMHVAAVWIRDGLPWRIVSGVRRAELERAQTDLVAKGFTPVDLSGCAVNEDVFHEETYTALWVKLETQVPSRLVVGLTKEKYEQVFAEAVEMGYFPRATWRFALRSGELRYCSVLFKSSPRPDYYVFGGTSGYFKNQIARGLPIEVGHFKEGSNLRLAGVVLTADKRSFVESHDGSPDEHLLQCQKFASQGLQPLVVSVLAGRGNSLEAASIWVDPAVGPFPELARPQPSPTVASTPPPEPPAANNGKIPLPSADEIDAATVKIREQLKTRLAANKAPVKQAVLSASLLAMAREESDSVMKYALLQWARDVGADSGDAWAALRALDELTATFDADKWTLRTELIDKASQKAKSEGARNQLAEAALSLGHEAAVEEKFDVAEKLITYARRVKDFAKVAAARGKLLAQQKHLAELAEPARSTIAQSPDDPAANLTLGRYFCFVKEDWEAGLPHLEKGSDEELVELAKKELAIPASAQEQFDLGEVWIAWANKNADQECNGGWRRAQHWFSQALPDLPGLVKAKALDHARNLTARMTQAGDVRRVRVDEQPVGEVMRLYGHSDAVTTLAPSRSGRWLVSGSRDDTVRVWDLTSAAEVSRIATSVNDITSLALLPDEQTLMIVGQTPKVVTASLAARSELSAFDTASIVQEIVVSADGRRLLLATNGAQGSVIVSEMDGKAQVALPVQNRPRAIDLSRSGAFAAVADQNNLVHFWDLRRPSEGGVLMGYATPVYDVAIAPNEELVAGCYVEGIVFWNTTTGKELNRLSVPRGAQFIAFTLDSRRLVAASSTRDLTIIDAQQGTILASLSARETRSSSSCEAIAVLSDGRSAVTAGSDGSIIVWRLPD